MLDDLKNALFLLKPPATEKGLPIGLGNFQATSIGLNHKQTLDAVRVPGIVKGPVPDTVGPLGKPLEQEKLATHAESLNIRRRQTSEPQKQTRQELTSQSFEEFLESNKLRYESARASKTEIQSAVDETYESLSKQPIEVSQSAHCPSPESAPPIAAAIEQPPSDRYTELNKKLFEQLLVDAAESEKMYLLITPDWLSRTLSDGTNSLDEDQALLVLQSAVAQRFNQFCLTRRLGLKEFTALDQNGLPLCISFLCITVLAGFFMQTDDTGHALNYYPRLAEMLGTVINSQRIPKGFDSTQFEELWFFFGDWLLEQYGVELALPEMRSGGGRYIAYPLKHVAFRQMDIAKLPLFFDWADFQAGQQLSANAIASKLDRWALVSQRLSKAGKNALQDERRDTVLAQVAKELKYWNGEFRDSHTNTCVSKSRIEIVLDWEGRPKLYFCPRRPPSYPTEWQDDENDLASNDGDCWYDSLPILPTDGEKLRSGFQWEMRKVTNNFRLHRIGSECIPLSPSNQMANIKMSRNSLPLGVESAVLIHRNALDTVVPYLTEICGKQISAREYRSLPEEWLFVKSVVPLPLPTRPTPPYECLQVDDDLDITLAGGAKLGRESKWLSGCPPTVLISGHVTDPVLFDGTDCLLVNNVAVVDLNRFSIGSHTVRCGRRKITFEIVEPEPVETRIDPKVAASQILCLPRNYVTILGALPGQIAHSSFLSKNGSLFQLTFEPCWALSVSPLRVLCLSDLSIDAKQLKFHKQTGIDKQFLDWARLIYEWSCKHAKLTHREGSVHIDAKARWQQFVNVAKEIKKVVRARRT
jgi:hypothetical protein